MRTSLLRDLGADAGSLPELAAYCRNPYRRGGQVPALPLPDEPHVALWRVYAEEAAARGAIVVLRERFPQFRFPIRRGISAEPGFRAATLRGEPVAGRPEPVEFADGAAISIAVHQTAAGGVPVIVAGERADFETLVRAFSERNEPVPVPAAMGACLIGGLQNWDRAEAHRASARARPPSGSPERKEIGRLGPDRARHQDRVLVLSRGPYSAVPAAATGRGEREWLRDSLNIRLEHECFHYLTSRLFGVIRSNLLDELLADAAGLLRTHGRYRADLALRFLGVAADGAPAPGARMRVYRGALSDSALAVLARMAVAAAGRLERMAEELPPAARTDVRTLVEWARRGWDGLLADG